MDEISVILAKYQGLGKITLCGCDTVHLSVGPVTLAVAPEAFIQTASMIRDAMEKLREILEAREQSSLSAPTPHDHQWTN